MNASGYSISRGIFLRVLGLIYFIAFLSFWIQMEGLVGKNGILPAVGFLKVAETQLGPLRYWLLPTVAWIYPSDAMLHLICLAGVTGSVALVLGVRRSALLALLWALYLSLVTVGRDFMEFQWDNLLLETGFLAIFLANSPVAAEWLVRWLLFRLMFSSGFVKLRSGDPAWRDLTALTFHYETQPLPTWIGWFAHQLPLGFHKLSCAVMFVIETAIPFLIFAPRTLRNFACVVLVTFQILIAATGNYCFFNLLAVALCLFLIDNETWLKIGMKRTTPEHAVLPRSTGRWTKWLIAPFATIILLVSGMQMSSLIGLRRQWPGPAPLLYQAVSPFRSINHYGLFAVMTPTRPEIIVEGSNDGQTWLPYEFKWKAGDLKRRPGFIAPHQPRLDWQMWFAALGSYENNPWFMAFMQKLLEGAPEVLGLLKKNPFPSTPPVYLRASLYNYHFTDLPSHRATGNWWEREEQGTYSHVLVQEK